MDGHMDGHDFLHFSWCIFLGCDHATAAARENRGFFFFQTVSSLSERRQLFLNNSFSSRRGGRGRSHRAEGGGRKRKKVHVVTYARNRIIQPIFERAAVVISNLVNSLGLRRGRIRDWLGGRCGKGDALHCCSGVYHLI